MRYVVPFLSQHEGIRDADWKWRGCGVAALKMVLDYWHQQNAKNRTASSEEMLQAGLQAGAYREGIGWTHRGLVELAREYGYEGANFDYAQQGPTPKGSEEALALLQKELEAGPVMASVFPNLDPKREGGHIVVVTEIEGDTIAFSDPEEKNAHDGEKRVLRETFLRGFKRRFIVVRPV